MRVTRQINLQDTPIIDNHCHPFSPVKSRLNLSDLCMLSHVGPRAIETATEDQKREWERQYVSSPPVFVSRLVLELGKLYRGEEWAISHLPEETEAILEERYERVQNYAEYIKFLFDDICLRTMIVDTGFPQPPIELSVFTDEMTCKVLYIFRSETLTDRLLKRKEPFSDFLASWESAIDEALTDSNCLGVKSIIAYRSGLDVHELSKTEAATNYEAYQRDGMADLKPLLDYLFIRAMEKTIQFDKVFQIHTGMGDVDIIGEKASPIFLLKLLKEPPFSSAKVILVHGGFPWVSEAASMVSLLPNVYMDLSLSCSLFPLRTNSRLLEALEQAPPRKILHGSDGFAIPEIMWLGGKLCKQSLEEVFSKLFEEQKISKLEGQEISKMILHKNAELLYGLNE